MPLQPGDVAPDLTLLDHDLRRVSLADYRGSPLVLFFFPLAFSDTCTEEMCTVAEDFSAYRELDGQVVGISVDSPYVLQRFREECGAEFPFLSDFHREAAEGFGVLRAEPLRSGLRGTSERATFVLDAEGRVTYGWVGEHPGLQPPFAEVKEALQQARHGSLR
ncbi:peroxiredoxin [soil metagenome]